MKFSCKVVDNDIEKLKLIQSGIRRNLDAIKEIEIKVMRKSNS